MNYDYKNIPKFKGWVLQNFPFIEADFDALTNYELYCKVVEYLNQVIANNNLMVENIEAINNYFNSLDVQEEIDNALNRLVEEGYFDELINSLFTNYENEINTRLNNYENSTNTRLNNYESAVNTQIQNQNNNINQKFTEQNQVLSTIETQVRNISSGAPIPVTSTSDMTNTSKIYVNTTDGKWYYYDGDSWEIGGTYQSTGIGLGEIKLNNLENALQSGILAYDGIPGAITTEGAIYTGNVGQTATLTQLSSYRVGEVSVVEGDLVAFNFVIYDSNYGNNALALVVDSNNTIIEKHNFSEFVETIDGRTLPKKVLLKMPEGASKVLFNEKITNISLGSTVNNPIFAPVKITSYNYCDNRLNTILTGKELKESIETLNSLCGLLAWELAIGNYKTAIYNVEPLEKIHIKTIIPEVYYLTLALFTDENDNVIDYLKPVGTNSRQNIDGDYIVPSYAKKMYICYNSSLGTPEVYKMIPGDDVTTNKKITATYDGGTLTLTSNSTGNNVVFQNFGGNNLFMIKSFKVDGNSHTLYTDMTPAPYIVNAINNANGDRTNEGFTGGNHQWNNQSTGSTATAEEINKLFYADDTTFISGTANCDKFTIIETNRVQANNTCLEAGGGRNVLEEKITFNYDGEKISVTTVITPLETINIKRYYGLQMVGSNFKIYEKKVFTSTSGLTTIPSCFTASNGLSMKIKKGGLGDYLYNNNTYGVIYESKAYYSPIYNNNVNFTTNDILYLSGEYIFSKYINI